MNDNSKGFIYAFIFSLAWAINVVLAGYAIVQFGINPYVYGAQTLFTAAFVFIVYILYQKMMHKQAPLTKKDIIILILMGVISNGIGNFFALKGIVHSPSNYAFLIKTSVFFTFLTELFLKQQKFDLKRFLLLSLLIVGALLISVDPKNLQIVREDLYSILAATCIGTVGAWSKNYISRNSPEWMAFFRSMGGAITLMFFAYFIDNTLGTVLHIEYGIIGGLLVFILFYFLYQLLEFKSASYASMMSMMFSIMVVILDYYFFDKKLTTIQLIGSGIIMAGVFLTEMYNKKVEQKNA